MKILIPLLALAMGLACVPPRVDMTHMPALSASEQGAQIRILPMPATAVFPKVLDVLLDQGFQIVSADRELGLVVVRRQWMEQQGANYPLLNVEATLLFSAEGPDRTRLRAQLAGSLTLNGGSKSTTTMHAQESMTAQDYAAVLDRLERGLCGAKGVVGSASR